MDDEEFRQKLLALFDEEERDKIEGLVCNGKLGSTPEAVLKSVVYMAFHLNSLQEYIVRGWVKMGKEDGWIIRNLARGYDTNNRRMLRGAKRDAGLIPETKGKEE